MIDLFDTPWDDLTPDALRAWLKTAGEDGVTWEAKADDEKRGRLHADSLRKAACGFANRDGGYVIVGAKRDADSGEWDLPGITKPDEEPELWVGRVLRDLRPAPRFVPRAWTLDAGRIAAVVWIEPGAPVATGAKRACGDVRARGASSYATT
jgi:predicted HTH transcriptional regulator